MNCWVRYSPLFKINTEKERNLQLFSIYRSDGRPQFILSIRTLMYNDREFSDVCNSDQIRNLQGSNEVERRALNVFSVFVCKINI